MLILSAKDKDSLTDEYISEMLNKSLFFEVNFKSEISTMLEKEMNVQPMSSDSGMVELFNSYTQTDSFIYDYIYDGNMNVVGTADSGGGNKRAALEIRLRAGDVYIIEISVRSTRLVGGMFHVERL